MRGYIVVFYVQMFVLSSFSMTGQELLDVDILEDGTIKSFVFKNQNGNLDGKWYMFLSPTDSILIARGPLLFDEAENRYLQNGWWRFYNGTQYSTRSSYVVGEEHFAALRENYFAGQSYSPIPLFLFNEKGSAFEKQLIKQDEIFFECGDFDLSTFQFKRDDISDCTPNASLLLPDLLISKDSRRLSAQAFSFELHLNTPALMQKPASDVYFSVDLAADNNTSYTLQANYKGDLYLGRKINASFEPMFTLEAVLDREKSNKLSIQFDIEGVFVLSCNDQMISSRELEFFNQTLSELGPINGTSNSIYLKDEVDISYINLSMFQFSDDPLRNLPYLYYKDILEISLGLINGDLSQSINEVYISDVYIASLIVDDRKDRNAKAFSALLKYQLKEISGSKECEMLLHFKLSTPGNKVISIDYETRDSGIEKLNLSSLGQQLDKKFGNNIYTYKGGLDHPNTTLKDLTVPNNLKKTTKSTGKFFKLTAKTSLRKGPSSRDAVLLRFRPENKVELIKKINKYWWEVTYKGNVGYVKAALLRPIN